MVVAGDYHSMIPGTGRALCSRAPHSYLAHQTELCRHQRFRTVSHPQHKSPQETSASCQLASAVCLPFSDCSGRSSNNARKTLSYIHLSTIAENLEPRSSPRQEPREGRHWKSFLEPSAISNLPPLCRLNARVLRPELTLSYQRWKHFPVRSPEELCCWRPSYLEEEGEEKCRTINRQYVCVCAEDDEAGLQVCVRGNSVDVIVEDAPTNNPQEQVFPGRPAVSSSLARSQSKPLWSKWQPSSFAPA